MNINKKDIKIFLFSATGFLMIAFYIHFSQKKEFEELINGEGRYTIGVGEGFQKNRTGYYFLYNYKINRRIYNGKTSFSTNKWVIKKDKIEMINITDNLGFEEGKLYFIVYNPKKPKKDYLIKYPAVPVGINMEDVPFEGWTELPVAVEKDSIKNFLND